MMTNDGEGDGAGRAYADRPPYTHTHTHTPRDAGPIELKAGHCGCRMSRKELYLAQTKSVSQSRSHRA